MEFNGFDRQDDKHDTLPPPIPLHPVSELRTEKAVRGGSFILDAPAQIPTLWGRDNEVLWAEGESLMIAGITGLGKTSLATQLVHSLLLGPDNVLGHVLGQPVTRTERRILFLAADRPSQIRRCMRRQQFREADRAVLDERLIVLEGPPEADLAQYPHLLLDMAQRHDAGIVLVDSLKDAAIGLSDDAVGAGWNRARQLLIRSGRELCELHHCVKHSSAARPTIADVYGSAWLVNGAGSVVLLTGTPGDLIVGFHHVKPVTDEVGPLTLIRDVVTGALRVHQGADLLALAVAAGDNGLTAKAAASALFGTDTPDRNQIEKARRALNREGELAKRGGGKGRSEGSEAAWFPLFPA